MKKTGFLLALSVFCLSASITAQNTEIIKLWTNGAPNNSGLTGEEIQLENGRIGNITDPSITVYHPENPNGMAIIMCPGGGYFRLAPNHEGFDMNKWFTSSGITYAVLKYRMPNGHPDVPVSDAEQAIRIFRQHAAEWKIDPNKIGIMGASAGGHLASTISTQPSSNDVQPNFQILLYPAISHLNSLHSSLLGENPSEELRIKYSSELQVTENTPPAFVVVSSDDNLVLNCIAYYLSLREHNVSATLHIYPTGGHGWGYNDDFYYKREWTQELEKWLRTF
ncbi:MAG: alpha/beta hydrolase [Bacteroidales bacterium]|jgi:acetyl esterase/lipase|nr:alpha/beta hydrolase [Bacteroidales bacterium]